MIQETFEREEKGCGTKMVDFRKSKDENYSMNNSTQGLVNKMLNRLKSWSS